MIDATQRIAKAIGSGGCYFLSLLKVAEEVTGRPFEPLAEFDKVRRAGLVEWDGFVNDAAKILALLTGRQWDVTKAGPGHTLPLTYLPRSHEREIIRYERAAQPGQEPAHFVVGDGQGRMAWDPWGDSETVRHGWIASKRILRPRA